MMARWSFWRGPPQSRSDQLLQSLIAYLWDPPAVLMSFSTIYLRDRVRPWHWDRSRKIDLSFTQWAGPSSDRLRHDWLWSRWWPRAPWCTSSSWLSCRTAVPKSRRDPFDRWLRSDCSNWYFWISKVRQFHTFWNCWSPRIWTVSRFSTHGRFLVGTCRWSQWSWVYLNWLIKVSECHRGQLAAQTGHQATPPISARRLYCCAPILDRAGHGELVQKCTTILYLSLSQRSGGSQPRCSRWLCPERKLQAEALSDWGFFRFRVLRTFPIPKRRGDHRTE